MQRAHLILEFTFGLAFFRDRQLFGVCREIPVCFGALDEVLRCVRRRDECDIVDAIVAILLVGGLDQMDPEADSSTLTNICEE